MSVIKKLAGQTAIYGASSIIGRLLNFLLVPLYTNVFSNAEYGVVTELYAFIAFLVVFLTYGMETAYFRYASFHKTDEPKIFNNTLIPVFSTGVLFAFICILSSGSIANGLNYPSNPEYIVWLALIVSMDAISAIPLARLRFQNRSKKFAMVNLASIFVNIAINVYFILYCKVQFDNGHSNWLIDATYSPAFGVGYIFIANLVASAVKFILLSPEMLKATFKISVDLLKQLLKYAFPLLIAGFAGIINETIDRILLSNMLTDQLGREAALGELGIYGACYKISIFITLFIQAFRYAAEPFFFAREKDKDAKKTYVVVMNYFVIVVATIFLGIMLYIDIVMNFVGESFRAGVAVVPILLFANICLGIYYNQSIWYKLSSKTKYGAYLAIGGALITLVLNLLWIPVFGYMGSAWATLICYASMMVGSYFLGQKHYPIPYNLKKIFLYLALSLGLYFLSILFKSDMVWLTYFVNTILLAAFLGVVYFLEKPTKKIVNS